MGYSIQYGPERFGREKSYDQWAGRIAAVGMLILGAAAVSVLVWPEGIMWLKDSMLQESSEAFGTLIHDLSQGVEIQEAITTFCREIIDNANLPAFTG